MSILINIPDRPLAKLISRLQQDIPAYEIEVWPNVKKPDDVEFALVWKHQHGSLNAFKNLKGLSSFGAGVDSILSDPDLPNVPIARIVDPDLATNMAQYVLTMIQHHKLRLNQFNQQQQQAIWKPKSPRKGNKVGILGLGQLGTKTAEVLLNTGFDVSGWSRSVKQLDKVTCYTGKAGFNTLVADSDYLVCLLPLTQQTKDILNTSVFKLMPIHSVLINVARGEHLVDVDLINALQNQELDFAYLDVFRQEPLPPEHTFWQSDKIQITPHVSAVTNVETAVVQVIENYRKVYLKAPMTNVIDRALNY